LFPWKGKDTFDGIVSANKKITAQDASIAFPWLHWRRYLKVCTKPARLLDVKVFGVR
jgi:hypothetical protein